MDLQFSFLSVGWHTEDSKASMSIHFLCTGSTKIILTALRLRTPRWSNSSRSKVPEHLFCTSSYRTLFSFHATLDPKIHLLTPIIQYDRLQMWYIYVLEYFIAYTQWLEQIRFDWAHSLDNINGFLTLQQRKKVNEEISNSHINYITISCS